MNSVPELYPALNRAIITDDDVVLYEYTIT
jgi:hypothetical protein